MTLRTTVILYVAATLLQMTAVTLIRVAGIGPNLILCLTIAMTFMFNNGYKVAPIAVICALFLDVGTAQYIGVGAFSVFVVMGIILLVRTQLNVDNIHPLLAVGAVVTPVYGIVYWLIMHILGNPMSFFYMLWHQPFYILYNLVVIAILYWPMRKRLEAIQRKADQYDYDLLADMTPEVHSIPQEENVES